MALQFTTCLQKRSYARSNIGLASENEFCGRQGKSLRYCYVTIACQLSGYSLMREMDHMLCTRIYKPVDSKELKNYSKEFIQKCFFKV